MLEDYKLPVATIATTTVTIATIVAGITVAVITMIAVLGATNPVPFVVLTRVTL